jgi:hypothetical protein
MGHVCVMNGTTGVTYGLRIGFRVALFLSVFSEPLDFGSRKYMLL